MAALSLIVLIVLFHGVAFTVAMYGAVRHRRPHVADRERGDEIALHVAVTSVAR